MRLYHDLTLDTQSPFDAISVAKTSSHDFHRFLIHMINALLQATRNLACEARTVLKIQSLRGL
jgi:hypothetical protein